MWLEELSDNYTTAVFVYYDNGNKEIADVRLNPCKMFCGERCQAQLSTVQLNLNLTHACGHTRVPARFMHVKVYNLACISFDARGFVVALMQLNTRGTLDVHDTSNSS